MPMTRKHFICSAFAAPGIAALGQAPASAQSPAYPGFGPTSGLGSLHLLTKAETRSVSPENPTGEKGKGGMAVPSPSLPFADHAAHLGQGWKVSPFLKPKAGEKVTLMDVEGPGVIQHIWLATERNFHGTGRACVLRFYWDDESDPSIEAPMTDFFAVGHDLFAPVNSLAVV